MTVGKTAKISSPSMKRRKSALGQDDLERETKALASFYPSPPPVDFVQSTVSPSTVPNTRKYLISAGSGIARPFRIVFKCEVSVSLLKTFDENTV